MRRSLPNHLKGSIGVSLNGMLARPHCPPKKKRRKERSRLSPWIRVRCPRCNGRMVLREGQYGEFWGCRMYPACSGTVSLRQRHDVEAVQSEEVGQTSVL